MLSKKEVTLRVGGAAGDGIASTGESFAKICARSGLNVFAYNSYQSVIRGGFIWLQVHAGRQDIHSHGDNLDFLIALNQKELERNHGDIADGGGIIFNSDKIKTDKIEINEKVKLFPIPVNGIISKFGKNPILQNTVALGALVKLVGMEYDILENVITDYFGKKKRSALEVNLSVSKAGYEYAEANFEKMDFDLECDYNKHRHLLTGNQSIALGAIAAGCQFYCAYPMTPASSILNWLDAKAAQTKMVVKQAEDEIAVLNMAIGAGFAGARSMVGTSGGGFSLMTEAVGLAAQTETPVVIINSMRGGPSTGLPTKTEQADLFQAIGASQGDFPKMVVAPSDVEDCFYTVTEAFNIAEKYQIPAIVLSDLLLSEHMETVEELDFDMEHYKEELGKPNGGRFRRYEFTENGVSQRSIPGVEGTIFQATSDEHNDFGDIISDVFTDEEMRARMQQKRMRKMGYLLKELPEPKLQGDSDADITLVGWGSTAPIIKEAMEVIQNDGIRVNHLHLKSLVPFHSDVVKNILNNAKNVLDIETNYTGQLSKLITMETGFTITNKLLKYDGEPIYSKHIINKIKEVI